MRATATLLVSLAMALGAIGLAVAAPGAGHPEPALAALQTASGAVSIANSRAGQAVFSAAAMRPGEGVSGTVRIGNDGQAPGRFAVRATGVHDDAGPNGGLLSERVRLVLLDVTDAQNPVTVYAGHPADFGDLELGTLEPGRGRDYRFEATLPDGGAPGSDAGGDNRFQGASLSLGLEWRAAEVAGAPTPAPTPAPAPAEAPSPSPTPAPAPAAPAPAPPTATATQLPDALGLPAARTCVKNGRLTLRLKAPAGAKVVAITVRVNGRVKARLKGAAARKAVSLRKLGHGSAKVTVSVRAGDGQTYSAGRTYRSC